MIILHLHTLSVPYPNFCLPNWSWSPSICHLCNIQPKGLPWNVIFGTAVDFGKGHHTREDATTICKATNIQKVNHTWLIICSTPSSKSYMKKKFGCLHFRQLERNILIWKFRIWHSMDVHEWFEAETSFLVCRNLLLILTLTISLA